MSSAYRVEEFRFEDGTVWTHEELTARGLIQQGTASAETITGFGSFSDLLFGGDGNDTLRGMASGDLLLGQAGNDILDGAAGYDVVAGGAGNDTILAAEIVFFNKGDGADRINSYGTGRTTISVGQADLAELSLVRSGQDVRLQVGDDSISMTAPGTNALSLQVIMTDGAAPDIKVFDLQGMVTFLYSQEAGQVMSGENDFAGYLVGEFSDAAYGGDLAVTYAQIGAVKPLVDANPGGVQGYLMNPNANQMQLLGGLNSPN